ncbi:hypothetical protein CU044_5266 [Streptomyces sp. L-9-10]|nr:hypothetical protein CU044_5266 [Streptomyces sp. L-9-10]
MLTHARSFNSNVTQHTQGSPKSSHPKSSPAHRPPHAMGHRSGFRRGTRIRAYPASFERVAEIPRETPPRNSLESLRGPS